MGPKTGTWNGKVVLIQAVLNSSHILRWVGAVVAILSPNGRFPKYFICVGPNPPPPAGEQRPAPDAQVLAAPGCKLLADFLAQNQTLQMLSIEGGDVGDDGAGQGRAGRWGGPLC